MHQFLAVKKIGFESVGGILCKRVTHGQHHFCLSKICVGSLIASRAVLSQTEGMILRQQSAGIHRLNKGYLVFLYELHQFCSTLAAHAAIAHDGQHLLVVLDALSQHVGSRLDSFRLRNNRLDVEHNGTEVRHLGCSDILWNADMHRAGATVEGRIDGILQDVTSVLSLLYNVGFLSRGRKHGMGIGSTAQSCRFIQGTLATLTHGCIAGDSQYRQ